MGSAVSGAMSILMAFITMLTSLFGILSGGSEPSVLQGFEVKPEAAIRVMSFNIRYGSVGSASWEDRIGIVSQTMLESEADSIGIQEGTPQWMATLKNTVGEKYAYVGVGRDDGVNAGEYSAIFYLKDKYTVIDSGTFWLSETPEVPSLGWDAGCNRICTWAVLENKETGEQYVHLNSHFDNSGTQARKNSVNLIVEKAKEYSNLPVVFTADMNVKEGSDNYKQLVGAGVLADTKFQAPDSMNYLTYHDTKPNKHSGDVIDYVMVNEHFEALSYKVVTEGVDGEYVSDHFPVYADIAVK